MKNLIRSLLFTIITVLFFNCSGKSDKELYDASLKSIKDGNYTEALQNFENLLKEYPESELAAKANFEIGKIYHGKLIQNLTGDESAKKALKHYKIVADKYVESDEAPNSLFMVGFIQANELGQLDEAKEAYNNFLQKYPENELAKSANAELENLGVPAEEILKRNLGEK